MTDAHDATDTWGEEAVVASFLRGDGPNPFSDESFELTSNNDVASGQTQAVDDMEWGGGSLNFAAVNSSADPWADIAPVQETQPANDMEWGGGSSSLAVTTSSADRWVDNTSAFSGNTTTSSDSWADNTSTFVNSNANTSGPWGAADIDSSQVMLASPASDENYDADISMSEPLDNSQDNTPISITTAPSPSHAEQSSNIMGVKSRIIPDESTGINPERLAMLGREEDSEDEILQEQGFVRPKGENFVQLPFNRLDKMRGK
jgi:hypothetical protein